MMSGRRTGPEEPVPCVPGTAVADGQAAAVELSITV